VPPSAAAVSLCPELALAHELEVRARSSSSDGAESLEAALEPVGSFDTTPAREAKGPPRVSWTQQRREGDRIDPELRRRRSAPGPTTCSRSQGFGSRIEGPESAQSTHFMQKLDCRSTERLGIEKPRARFIGAKHFQTVASITVLHPAAGLGQKGAMPGLVSTEAPGPQHSGWDSSPVISRRDWRLAIGLGEFDEKAS